MTGNLPKKPRDRSSYANYIRKAKEFIKTMEDCIQKGQFDSAALSGIHAIISSIDAILVFHHGVVSASQNHEDAVKLLIELVSGQDTREKAKHALAVIKHKITVEYWDTLTTRGQAIDIAKHVTRFFDWASSKLPAI